MKWASEMSMLERLLRKEKSGFKEWHLIVCSKNYFETLLWQGKELVSFDVDPASPAAEIHWAGFTVFIGQVLCFGLLAIPLKSDESQV